MSDRKSVKAPINGMLRSLFSTVLIGLVLPFLLEAEVPHFKISLFPQEIAKAYTMDDGLPTNDVHAIHMGADGGVFAVTSEGWAHFSDGDWSPSNAPKPDKLIGHIGNSRYATIVNIANQVATGPDNQITVATTSGLMTQDGTTFKPLTVMDGLGRQWGVSDVRGVAYDTMGQLWFATLAGAACRTKEGWKFHTGIDGVPHTDFTVIEAAPDGIVWFGTHLGAVRFDGREWAYRQGKRWLPNDDIRDIAIDTEGSAWFATAGGVGFIERRLMTLAQKAEHYEEEMERYIRRTPLGYVSEVGLASPGNKTRISQNDSDNDGLWTSMYGAGECFAYAATQEPKAKDRARRAFEALRFLQKVTQGTRHSPPKGYVARTIRSVDLPDPNIGRIARDRQVKAGRDALWKVYEPRWPMSADGKWYWKSDTSSDEIDGHYFFYPLYYDLVADTPEEKERVREVVRDLTDHLIQHDYNLVDFDGKPTRWGHYSPDSLNHDPDWWEERGLKSLSMLSYLTVAEHMTGDPKYGRHINKLIRDHAYDTNAMIYKIHRGIGSGNQSDDEMAFMSYYNLVKYTRNEELKNKILFSFFSAWTNEQPEMNPFFNFAYAALGLNAQFADAWGSHSITPWEGWLEDSMATLMGFPLDRLDWACRNSHRSDLVHLPRQQTVELRNSSASRHGYRVNGKVLPVENRHFNHWNTNPWVLDYGGNGTGLASGTVFLLPYYMGLYHGFIREVKTGEN